MWHPLWYLEESSQVRCEEISINKYVQYQWNSWVLGFVNWTSQMEEQSRWLTPPFPIFYIFYFWTKSSQFFPASDIHLYKIEFTKNEIHSKTQDTAKFKEKMKICSTVNPSTTREIHIDFFGSRDLRDRCLCLNCSTDKWKTLFSSDPGILMWKKQKHNWKNVISFSYFGKLRNKGNCL